MKQSDRLGAGMGGQVRTRSGSGESQAPPDKAFAPLGDSALRIAFGQGISTEVHHRIQRFCQLMETSPPPGVVEWMPTYTAVTLYYRPGEITYDQLTEEISRRLDQLPSIPPPTPRLVRVPVCYGGGFGPDLHNVAAHNKLTPDEVIAIHTSADYLVYMLGFAPGFAYMGGLPTQISTPRLPCPRRHVAAGSVGIAGEQTGIYPLPTPGGWQIIGRTPLVLYNSQWDQPTLFAPGDQVQFYAVGQEEYETIKAREEQCAPST